MDSKLHFGCGKKIWHGYLNADIQPYPGVDALFDFEKIPYPFEDNTFSTIYSSNVLEHLQVLPKVVDELWRISRHDAEIEIIVPYYNFRGAFNDPTHYHYFNEETLKMLFVEPRFELIQLKCIPTKYGKMLMHPRLIKFASCFIGHLIKHVHGKFRVRKDAPETLEFSKL